jgi:hypothetical protein
LTLCESAICGRNRSRSAAPGRLADDYSDDLSHPDSDSAIPRPAAACGCGASFKASHERAAIDLTAQVRLLLNRQQHDRAWALFQEDSPVGELNRDAAVARLEAGCTRNERGAIASS